MELSVGEYEKHIEGSPFIPGPVLVRAATRRGTLDGLTFAVKDLIDVEGVRTGRGNPDYLAQAEVSEHTATCVEQLLAAGATLTGKTITDEFAFSLEGNNTHYGTPLNPRCIDRIPGGSSSGSASAVAAGLVDFALGTDTGGSVRVPAAFCGVYGMRPSHGAIAIDGVMPFAPSYDCVGLLAGNIDVLSDVARVLIPSDPVQDDESLSALELFCVEDAFSLAENNIADTLYSIASEFAETPGITIFDNKPDDWLHAYTTLQGHEIWALYRKDIEEKKFKFGNDVASRFDSCRDIDSDQVAYSQDLRNAFKARLDSLIPENKALVIPTTPTLPLAKGSSQDVIQRFYQSSLTLNSIAGHAGLPQISFPVGELMGCPLSMSIIARRGSDFRLLTTVRKLIDYFDIENEYG